VDNRVIVRVAGIGDLPRLLKLCREMEQVDGVEDTSDSPAVGVATLSPLDRKDVFIQMLTSPYLTVLVAQRGQELIGTLTLAVHPGLAHGGRPWAVVESVVVAETHHGQGIRTVLMETAIGQAQAAGCYKLAVITDLAPGSVRDFYEKLGLRHAYAGYELELRTAPPSDGIEILRRAFA